MLGVAMPTVSVSDPADTGIRNAFFHWRGDPLVARVERREDPSSNVTYFSEGESNPEAINPSTTITCSSLPELSMEPDLLPSFGIFKTRRRERAEREPSLSVFREVTGLEE